MRELINIQQSLVAKKDKYNAFGKYGYRSAEGILESLKKHLKDNKCYLILTDRVEVRGDRYYVVATATLYNEEGKSVSASAEAREEDTKKGMDAAQVTGSASSYARKYALCGLFAIDDGVDPDLTNKHGKEDKTGQADPFAQIKAEVANCKTKAELSALFGKYPENTKDPAYVAIFTHRKNQLP